MQDHHTTTPGVVTTNVVLPRGEQGILPRGSQTFKGPHEAFILMIFTFMGCIFMLFLTFRHCLDSISKCLGRIISNDFTVSVDILFDGVNTSYKN